jgi:hypothetical protein
MSYSPSIWAVGHLLSFDPGLSTGIAFLREGVPVWGMVATPQAFESEVFLLSLTRMTSPDAVLIEKPPSSTKFGPPEHAQIYQLILAWYTKAGYSVHSINPGLWKGLVERSKLDAVHIRDAADMALWFYEKNKTNDTAKTRTRR